MFFTFYFRFWKLPYYLAGIKAYDVVSGKECLKNSFVLGKERALELFPMLKRDKLKGAIVYYDGECKISVQQITECILFSYGIIMSILL